MTAEEFISSTTPAAFWAAILARIPTDARKWFGDNVKQVHLETMNNGAHLAVVLDFKEHADFAAASAKRWDAELFAATFAANMDTIKASRPIYISKATTPADRLGG